MMSYVSSLQPTPLIAEIEYTGPVQPKDFINVPPTYQFYLKSTNVVFGTRVHRIS
jgi:hypothetical protein